MQWLNDILREIDERLANWFVNGPGCFVMVFILLAIIGFLALMQRPGCG